MKYKPNDTIVYPCYGICRISEIAPKTIGGQTIECYQIHPVHDQKCQILIPTNNKKAMAKMCRPLSRREVYSLFDDLPEESGVWIENSTLRKKRFEEILTSNDRRAMVRLIKTLHQRRRDRNANGRKLQASDEQCLQAAEKMLHEEISYVLGLRDEEVLPFIHQRLAEKKKGSVPVSEG